MDGTRYSSSLRVGKSWHNEELCRQIADVVGYEEAHMSKRGRKRKSRRKNSANHGKRPNA